MKFIKRKPSLMLVLVAALIALLPLLAVLQFRWLGEVSQAERERMQASLKTAVTSFSQDFDREITRAYIAFQMDARVLRDRAWSDYAKRYDQWMQTATYPQLVSGIYLVEKDEQQHPRLARFNRAASQFEPADWSAQDEALRTCFEKEFRGERDTIATIMKSSFEVVGDDAPALVMPIPDFAKLEKQSLPPPSIMFSSYVVATLNADFIKQQFIPQLAARYFASGDGLDYALAITSRDEPQKVIYQSDANAAEKITANADATAALLGVRFELPLPGEDTPRDAVTAVGATRNVETVVSGKEAKSQINLRYFNMSTVIKKKGGVDGSPLMIARLDHNTGRWLVALKHRAGSLDAAVASARRRNLFVSFGILLMLSVSIAMIIISTRRAARLARQQMEFVAGVSHEMRTPLAVICSAGENLADGVIDDREQVRKYGALIEGEGRRLSEMIEQALEFAGIQSGRQTYARRPVEPNAVIESALAACAPLIAEGGFTVEKEIASPLPVIEADAAALSRSLQNLLSNAMKYSGTSQTIRLKAVRVASARSDEIQITVEDRGLGIAPSEVSHIFEPFYRGRDVMAAQIHGNGLGLSLVKHIIEAHGGSVAVDSVAGRGSTFTLRLPIAAQADQAHEEHVEFSISGKG